MAGIGQYLRDTQGELRHVAWPTRTQTIVYTILVALISVGIALYLGLFDYLFTTALTKTIDMIPAQVQSGITVTQQPAAQTTQTPTNTSSAPAPQFNIPGATSNTKQ